MDPSMCLIRKPPGLLPEFDYYFPGKAIFKKNLLRYLNMINGTHIVIYSKDPIADRSFLRDILNLPFVDAGNDWLIFALPPSEVALHPTDKKERHEFFLMCDHIEAFRNTMIEAGIKCTEVTDEGWGLLIKIRLPGGGNLGVYEPRHTRPV